MMMPLRSCPLAVGLSKPEFAARLGVSAETYRTWDSGRHQTPASTLEKAEQSSQAAAGNQLLALSRLAGLLGLLVRTLRLATRNGRLEAFCGHRTLFGHPIPRATLAVGSAFMPSVNHPNIATIIARGPLVLAEAARIALQIDHGISSAHARAIVHRDLKPANLRLALDGRVSLRPR